MSRRERCEAGDTLVEILTALVIIGLIVGAYFATIQTSAASSKAHRDLVSADAVLRDYAEATKQAVRSRCGGSSNFTVTPPPIPAGFSVTVTVASSSTSPFACPSATTVSRVDFNETLPSGTHKSLSIDVRKP